MYHPTVHLPQRTVSEHATRAVLSRAAEGRAEANNNGNISNGDSNNNNNNNESHNIVDYTNSNNNKGSRRGLLTGRADGAGLGDLAEGLHGARQPRAVEEPRGTCVYNTYVCVYMYIYIYNVIYIYIYIIIHIISLSLSSAKT